MMQRRSKSEVNRRRFSLCGPRSRNSPRGSCRSESGSDPLLFFIPRQSSLTIFRRRALVRTAAFASAMSSDVPATPASPSDLFCGRSAIYRRARHPLARSQMSHASITRATYTSCSTERGNGLLKQLLSFLSRSCAGARSGPLDSPTRCDCMRVPIPSRERSRERSSVASLAASTLLRHSQNS